MKLIYKGIYTSKTKLPDSNLPMNAVRFREPTNDILLTLVSLIVAVPMVQFTLWLVTNKVGNIVFLFSNDLLKWHTLGMLLALVCIVPHELLHAVCFSKSAVVNLYFAPMSLSMFIVCNEPVKKWRFVFMSLLPSIILGWFPLLIYIVTPYDSINSCILASFSTVSIAMCCGDYLNIFNAITQMPKGSYQQLSGFNSYWFIDEIKE